MSHPIICPYIPFLMKMKNVQLMKYVSFYFLAQLDIYLSIYQSIYLSIYLSILHLAVHVHLYMREVDSRNNYILNESVRKSFEFEIRLNHCSVVLVIN